MSQEEYPIRWTPSHVCACVIYQHRHDPDNQYRFEYMCEEHRNMSEVDARADIINRSIALME